ncbi:HAMP domain-containing histidine kinase [Pseudomonas sp. PDM17]|uniref:sensor histidine kinase n=1 Tax=Pseudomonas sp. PDM17 TaxID=2769285 RepID=UPI00177CB808|nr:HAMP domain-containing sensor histidine kinase [Pseudomonas sp. PDM17]MBD9504606.1 HAMP domain-containing histidine kinase [Pseudomonas sp. PDM17]
MAGLAKSISRLLQNIGRAKARVLVFGTLLVMIIIVLLGTVLVLRLSYSPVVKQYQIGIQRTLQRVASDFESLDGRIAFMNIDRPAPGEGGLPLTRLPLDYLNYLPGHIEEIKQLDACSYPYISQPNSEICAGILESRKNGAMAYIQGSFDLVGEIKPPVYSKSPTSGHHFLVSIEARGQKREFVVTFDLVRRPDYAGKSAVPDAWSMTGFRYLGDGMQSYTREPNIKGRILIADAANSHYQFILQVPIQAYMEDALTDERAWPPEDISKSKVTLRVVTPADNVPEQTITDTAELQTIPRFSFSGTSEYLALGETLTFSPPTVARGEAIEVRSSQAAASRAERSGVRRVIESISDTFIRTVTPSISTQKTYSFVDGSSIELNGNASLVLSGWRSAAHASITFALLLCTFLILAGVILHLYLLSPLNNLRRNTLYLRDKFSDAESFKLPYAITNKSDEIGVLWASILDLHRSITSYGREALENASRHADFLRALGHEIKSPLQDLTIRHSSPQDPSSKSVKRITHALKILSSSPMGTTEISPSAISPKEAISSFRGKLSRENVSEYLSNAEESYPDIKNNSRDQLLTVSADAELLEAALTAILNNAQDFREPGTEITITAYNDADWVLIHIFNTGPYIKNQPIEEIFEFGVSSRSGENEHQGMGLFAARQHIVNMGGDLTVKNMDNGVRFDIKLIRAK